MVCDISRESARTWPEDKWWLAKWPFDCGIRNSDCGFGKTEGREQTTENRWQPCDKLGTSGRTQRSEIVKRGTPLFFCVSQVPGTKDQGSGVGGQQDDVEMGRNGDAARKRFQVSGH